MAAENRKSACHGALFGTRSVVCRYYCAGAEEKKAQAIAMMFAGLTLANVPRRSVRHRARPKLSAGGIRLRPWVVIGSPRIALTLAARKCPLPA